MKPTDITKIRQHLKNIEEYYTKRNGQLRSPMYVRQELKQALDLLPCSTCNGTGYVGPFKLGYAAELCPDCQPRTCVCCEEVTRENAHLHRNCGK